MALFRLPRLLRFYNLAIFFDRLDQNLPFPLLIRLTRTVNTMVYLVHIAGCAYYGFSKFEGIGSTSKNYMLYPEKLWTMRFNLKFRILTIRIVFYSIFTGFVYDGHGNAYIRCFYIGLKSAVSIGKNPKPGRNNVYEMGFMWVMWISGVFVFAILIGNRFLI